MLSLLAVSYNTVRLGLEAQNAAAFRLLRLAGRQQKTSYSVSDCPPCK